MDRLKILSKILFKSIVIGNSLYIFSCALSRFLNQFKEPDAWANWSSIWVWLIGICVSIITPYIIGIVDCRRTNRTNVTMLFAMIYPFFALSFFLIYCGLVTATGKLFIFW